MSYTCIGSEWLARRGAPVGGRMVIQEVKWRPTARVTCSPPSVTLVAHNLATVASQVDAGLGPTLALPHKMRPAAHDGEPSPHRRHNAPPTEGDTRRTDESHPR